MLFTRLAQRDKQPEIQDQPGVPSTHHEDALRGLARINWVSNSDGILWRPIRKLAEEMRGQPLRVLDIATGGGDVPMRLHRRAHRAGLPLLFAGADVSPTAIGYARQQAQRGEIAVDFFELDAVRMPLPADYDVITCSLFLHHLETAQAVDLLQRMKNASRRMVLVNDLHRSTLGLILAYLGGRLLSRSYIVHSDAPQSVRAAFTVGEVRELAEQAGMPEASISRRWPFRFLLEWRRPA
ncbi:MAG: methyltransferase domain-containing protein [Planctomycetes bacterium]|nr:methyltransferase domain-containing protein [Planctomycetota bacterium]